MKKHKDNIIKSLKNKWFWVIYIPYIIAAIGLFLYSFFQIDLNLTLINHPVFLEVQKPFIHFGYYQRPASVNVYIALLLVFFILYILTLRLIWIKKLSLYHLGILIGTLCVVLFLAYPASFSHDIFNYMFDARIVTEYGQNPYTHKALDFPADPWIRFMHWTHRTYPYGPVWLVVTIPFSFIGLGKFLIILVLFKVLIIISYLFVTYYIYKILQVLNHRFAIIGAAFFALNPLVIIEGLISAHNDVLMMAFAVLSIYLLIQKKRVSAIGMFLLSVGVKFTTIFLAPFLIINYRPFLAFLLALATFCAISYRIGIQPWYFLWVMPFAALACMHRFTRVIMITIPFVFLLRYIPFIASGSWYPSAIPFQYWATVVGVITTVIIYLGLLLWHKKIKIG
jgi:hypothetical protein